MSMETKISAAKSKALKQLPFAKERQTFKALLLTNPNYFGNLVGSELIPIVPILGNTYYEELTCLGYHPQQRQLEGVVYIYQTSGYGSGICGPGTPEYVRFYLSYDSGATWQDQGMSSFQAHNIPEGTAGSKHLEYAVSLEVHPDAKFCFSDPLIRARAILSWNDPPLPNQPNWNPVWGNVLEVPILVEPIRIIFPPEIFEIAKVKIPPYLAEILPPDVPIQTKKKVFTAAELAVHYKAKRVPVHRFAYKELSNFVTAKTTLNAGAFAKLLPGVVFDPDIVGKLFPKTDGDTSYEELKCIGLDPNFPDTLAGVIQIKRSSGYSGGPCSDGSREYVTFWGDFDGNDSFETCLGTAQVQVYDVDVPPQGVFYAVRLPVDLTPYRQPCQNGPKNVRIRAILSWNVAVDCADPSHVPVWGNREETLINIAPGVAEPAGKIGILGGIPVSKIDSITGLTTPDAVFALNNLPPDNPDGNLLTPDGRPCPFAGRVSVQGYPVVGCSYKVEVTPAGGGAPTPVVTDLTVTDSNGNTSPHSADPVTLRFDYLPTSQNMICLLAQWDTTGDAKWEVKLSVYDAGGILLSTDTHLIQLDNTWPEASINITTGPGNCGKFTIGTLLQGKFVARDLYLSSYNLYLTPSVNPPGIGVPSPSSGLVNTAVAPGDDWSLDTTLMATCGYVINVQVIDRAIVNSQSLGHYSYGSAGFCLEAGPTVTKKKASSG